jgi:hypothetical protein
MWLDAFIYLPLVILGIHRLMDQRKPTLLFVSYFLKRSSKIRNDSRFISLPVCKRSCKIVQEGKQPNHKAKIIICNEKQEITDKQ